MASQIAGYEYDIFISYRQNDNKYDGWVTEFIENLNKELEATIKEKVNVYFDSNPHDGLLETHLVSNSLEEKLRCLIFIPILSRTYCDSKSFAWNSEFLTFIRKARDDKYGINVKVASGNYASRILPIRIHELEPEDVKLVESQIGYIRSVDFIYRSIGVNRPLRAHEDHPSDNLNNTYYRDQINKVAYAIDELLSGLRKAEKVLSKGTDHIENGISVKEISSPEPAIKYEKKNLRDIRSGTRKKMKISMPSTRIIRVTGISAVLLVCFFIIRYIIMLNHRSIARNELIPRLQRLVDDNFTPPAQAFDLASEADKYIPDDSVLIGLWTKVSGVISLNTSPQGAGFYWKSYEDPASQWKFLGITPLKDIRIPLGFKRMLLVKDGYDSICFTNLLIYGSAAERHINLDAVGSLPDNMVRIPSKVTDMNIVGLEHHGGKKVFEFLVDRFEVTNKEYKDFMDSGGYENRSLWKYPIYVNGKEIPFESALDVFVDKTGKRGPATWEVGSYPEGQENNPVCGISWYEAAAFAASKGKKLPSVFQWSVIAETNRSMYIVPLSNYNGRNTLPVGYSKGISSCGIYDLAGNVREWCFNEGNKPDQRYILGGGWNDPPYSFNDAGTQPSIDRSVSNGFRCVKELPGDSSSNLLYGKVDLEFRDYNKEKPVDDKTFGFYAQQFSYDKKELNPEVLTDNSSDFWKIEKVTMNAAYNDEKLIVWIFLPKEGSPPFQPVILFPGSNFITAKSFKSSYVNFLDFIVKDGRALVVPILKSTCERGDELKSDLSNSTVFYKDHVIMWRKDISCTIDYLETRNDILSDKIGYFGFSWGGFMGGIIPAVEPRFKAVVLFVGGMGMGKSLPEVDQINFIPRVRQPVLMLNGKYDMYFPEETSQKPMYRLLGTPAKDKKILIYDTGHLVPRQDLIRETLKWFDQYLGEVSM